MQLLWFSHASTAQLYELRLHNMCCIGHFFTDAFLCSSTMLQALRLNRPGTAAFCPPVPGIPDSLPGQIEESDKIMQTDICRDVTTVYVEALAPLQPCCVSIIFSIFADCFSINFQTFAFLLIIYSAWFSLIVYSNEAKCLRWRGWVIPMDQNVAIQYILWSLCRFN